MAKTTKKFPISILFLLLLSALVTLFINSSIQNQVKITKTNQVVNKGNCLADDCLQVENLEFPVSSLPASVKKTLDQAIEDEYKALGFYEAVISKNGQVRPFSMIKGAEEVHISSLKSIYDKYGLKYPAKTINKINVPPTIKEACQIGYDAEVSNAKLYKESLLPLVVSFPDISLVYTNLMNASVQKHMIAFERCK